jgi:signal transduction histidine kinase/ActR/RegA family two-component response regulator
MIAKSQKLFKEASASVDDADQQILEEELLQLLARQGRRVPIPVFLTATLLAFMAAGRFQPPWIVWMWLALVALVLLVRWKILGVLPSTTRWTRAEKLKITIFLSGINGVVHGASVIFLPALAGLEKAFQAILLLGLCAGSVATTTGYRPVFVAFVAPTLLPLAVAWAIGSNTDGLRWTELSTALLILVFGALLMTLARDAFHLFKESFEIRQQQAVLNRQLRDALANAETANRAKTRFLAAASHDLRQPMHTLSLFGAALSMRPLDEGSRQIAKHMSTALQSLGAQLDALLDVSKLDAGVVPVRPTRISLEEFLHRIDSEFRPLAESKKLSLFIECPSDAICETDELLFGRIVRNLVDNAIKYTVTGSVTVQAQAVNSNWLLSIRDTGVGIADSEHEHVFEEFYQVDNPERDRTRGLGLGLSIVKRLTALLHIGMQMQSAPGKGTEFRLDVPRGRQARSPPTLHSSSSASSSLAGVRVLVLDDEEAVREGMRSLMQAYGAEVRLAGCIAEALEMARREKPDIVLADLRLRGEENGITAISELRQVHPGLPALLISGDIAPDRLQQTLSAGVRALHKPVSVEVLRCAIDQELRNGGHHERNAQRALTGRTKF